MADLALVPPLPAPSELAAEFERFWCDLAMTATRGLAAVHPDHPDRPQMCRVAALAHRAAGLPAVRLHDMEVER